MVGGKRFAASLVLELFVAAQVPFLALGVPSATARAAVYARQEVTPGNRAVIALGGVLLQIPVGAVTRPVTVNIIRRAVSEPLGDSMRNVTPGGAIYRFEPHGLHFSRPVRLTIPFDRHLLESESDLSNLFTYFFDEESRRWERLPRHSIDREQATITSTTCHFTDMVNATLTLPQGASPLQFDVNSIKSLRAADPGAGVPLPEGLEPGPFGSAAFSIPLRIPTGRGGATPGLALRYDSGHANGWLGKGFDVDVPAVTTDTRFGLPRYDGRDTYILHGEELVPWGADGAALRFRPRTEKSFQRVRWFRSGIEDFWEVTDKSGEVREYGRGEAWLGPSRSDRSRTFTWYLSRIRDVFGNTVDYEYAFDQPNACTYLAGIRYAGSEGTRPAEGLFRVRFLREDREDRRLDCRGRFASRMASRLSRVEVLFRDELIRWYDLHYQRSEFGQSLLSSFSEKDASGAEFFTYNFDYHALPERRDVQGNLIGYDAFGEAEQQWEAPSRPGSPGLQTSRRITAGGSLYTGVEISIRIPFFGKFVIANFGIRGGLDFSTGFSKEELFDLNGDGLLDSVWRQGSSIAASLNNGAGFDPASTFLLPGMGVRMDEESGLTGSLGISATLLMHSGGLTKQWSSTEAQTGFADVNGDGFPDVVGKGLSNYFLNTGVSLVPTPWRFGPPVEPGPAGEDPNEDEYQRAYFLEEPVRKWKAYRGGAIEITHAARLVSPESVRDEGVSLFTHFRDATSLIRLGSVAPSASATEQHIVAAGDELYFHVSAGQRELGKDTDWNVRIRYTGIRLFEDMARTGLFMPPVEFPFEVPYGDDRLDPIYTKREGSSKHILIPDWESMDAEVLRPVYDALVEHGAFVPQQLTQEQFETLREALGQEFAFFSTYTDPVNGELRRGSVSSADVLLSSYGFVPEMGVFYRHAADADPFILKKLAGAFSVSQLRELATCKMLDGSRVFPRLEGSSFAHTAAGVSTPVQPAILSVSADAPLGACVDGKGFLLDRTWRDVGASQPLEFFWLRRDPLGQWHLYREDESGEREEGTAGFTVSDQGGTTSIQFSDRGLRRNILFSGKSALLERIPGALYEGPLSDHLLQGESFSTYGISRIPESSWQWLWTRLSDVERSLFDACYSSQSDTRVLRESITQEDMIAVLKKIHALIHQPGSIFNTLPMDLLACRRIVLLDSDDFMSFCASGEPGLAACFFSFNEDSTTTYYTRADLDEDERLLLHDAMARFRRDVEVFPFYSLNKQTGERELKAGIVESDMEKVRQALGACGLSVWTEIRRSITYRSDSLLPVDAASLPEGMREETFFPSGSQASSPQRKSGIVNIPFIEPGGRTVLLQRFIHVFDSLADYSAEDLVLRTAQTDAYESTESFKGGAFGWFYGIWIGYYPWNEHLLNEKPPASASGEVAPPPYFFAMSPNADAQGNLSLAQDGRETVIEVQPDAWVGPVTIYSTPRLDDADDSSTQEYRFAAFIHGDRLHPRRNGGDAYYHLPREAGTDGTGVLAAFRSSRSESRDINGGLSLGVGPLSLGGSISSNVGESWQWRGFLDIDGNRYPDLLDFKPSRSGSGSFRSIPGTGAGFGIASNLISPFSHFAAYRNNIVGFGASISNSSGGVQLNIGADAKVDSSSTRAPDPSVNAGANGTVGSSYQSEGFVDINGDGLPDHMRRDGPGDYSVALNSGSTAFASPVSWGSGIAVPLLSEISSLAAQSSGLTHFSSGSFGVSASIGGGIGGIGVGASAGFAGSVNQTWSRLEDMNGDGLPDQVIKLGDEPFFRVRFNLGDSFDEEVVRLYRPDWDISMADVLRAAVMQDLETISGILDDLHLPRGASLPGLRLPSGQNPVQCVVDPFSMADVLEYSGGASFNLGASLTFELRFVLLALTFSIGVNGSVAQTTTSLKLTDINGDGLPDHVLKLPQESFLRVKLNASGKSGLLKTVRLPQGGRYEIDYTRAGNTVDMPQCLWVVSRVTRDDGLGSLAADRGVYRYSEGFAFGDGYYDRLEREFRGFAWARHVRTDGSEERVAYLNRDHHSRGMEWRRQVYAPVQQGEPMAVWIERNWRIQERIIEGTDVAFPAVTEETQRVFEPGSERSCESRKTFAYDDYGNVQDFVDEGDARASNDDLRAHINFAELPGYLKQHPASIQVTDASGTLLRFRQGEYGSRGELLLLRQYDTPTGSHAWEMGWDEYGNLLRLSDPRGCTIEWEYDAVVHRYVTVTRSANSRLGSPQYESRAQWDYRWGTETEKRDINSELMSFAYDDFGRLVEVRSPYDTGGTPAVRYSYNAFGFPWSAITQNKVSFDPSDAQVLATVLTIDGLGRSVQTAKQGEVWESGQRRLGWNLSGALAYDEKGRVIAEGQPQFAEGLDLPGLARMTRPTQRAYDALDRGTHVVFPDQAETITSFPVRDGQLVERTRDPRGNIFEKVFDARNNIVETRRLDSTDRLLASARYSYDAMGEILEVTDGAGNRVKSSYDLMGRRVRLESPDAGVVEYTYDEAGNLVRKVDSVRRGRGESIQYLYDGLNRLVRIDYPRITDVTNTYGGPGAPNCGAGRIVERQDESGSVRYRYGRLGETVGLDRTIARLTPMAADMSASFSYVYDYLGRMQCITYPDGETVSYGYDAGGQVRSVEGEHYGRHTKYVQDIGYDQFGQRVFMKFGNGMETRYSYDENRRWLDAINTTDSWSRVQQDMQYRFDEVGNVLGVQNDARGYQTQMSYDYDALYQLTSASGRSSAQSAGVTEYTSTYSQTFSFDAIGNMTAKRSKLKTSPRMDVGAALDYSLDYACYEGKAHQVERIGQLWYRYDANGNQVEERQGGHSEQPLTEAELTKSGDLRTVNRGFGLTRRSNEATGVYARYFVWDEENRLRRSIEGSESVDYRYGAEGNRTVKYSPAGETLYFDAMWQGSEDYPSFRMSKHVYVGQSRVATRCNITGQLDVGYEEVNTYYYHPDHLGSAQLVSDAQGEVYQHMEYTPYGEVWIEKERDSTGKAPFRFTGKELDVETGLYYYGARYMDPRTSRWISADPAMESYLPEAPVSDEARRLNGNLPGMGGVFNAVNLAVYTYAGNNPVIYKDPDGNLITHFTSELKMQTSPWGAENLPGTEVHVSDQGCAVTFFSNAVNTMKGSQDVTPSDLVSDASLFKDDNSGRILFDVAGAKYGLGTSKYGGSDFGEKLKRLNRANVEYAIGVNVRYNSEGNTHWVGVNSVKTIGDEVYLEVAPTSTGDIDETSRMLSSWRKEGDKMYVNASEVRDLVFYWKEPGD